MLPLVGPVMVVFGGTESVPLESVIVCAARKGCRIEADIARTCVQRKGQRIAQAA